MSKYKLYSYVNQLASPVENSNQKIRGGIVLSQESLNSGDWKPSRTLKDQIPFHLSRHLPQYIAAPCLSLVSGVETETQIAMTEII